MEQGAVQYASDGKTFYLRFCGDVRLPWCPSFEAFCEEAISLVGYLSLVIDLNRAHNLDSTTLGTLAKVALRTARITQQKPLLYCNDQDLIRLLESMGLHNIIDIRLSSLQTDLNFRSIDLRPIGEGDMQDAVISAHEQLIALEEQNRSRFEGLVSTLRSEATLRRESAAHDDKPLNNK